MDTTILWPFFRHHLGEPVPEENFWTSWCKGRLTEADTQTIRLGATPSGLTSAYLKHPFFTGWMPFLPPNSVNTLKANVRVRSVRVQSAAIYDSNALRCTWNYCT